jgi:DNA-directed RNA polymerase subunit L
MDKATLEITKEDHDLLIVGLRSIPMQGTIDSLPKAMEKVIDLMKRVQGAFEEKEVE